MPKLTVLSLLALAVACSPSSTWEGLKIDANDRTIAIGGFRSLDACKTKMGETGGYCGRGCHHYSNELVADCIELIEVEKR